MQIRLTLKPGQKGTKKLLKRYGDRLVCVRYRYDPRNKKRYKTVELIEEELDWDVKSPLPGPETKVELKVDWGEADIGVKVKRAGGVWNAEKKVWEIAFGQVERLGLVERIVGW